MVERFVINKLYINSRVPTTIVKCDFITSDRLGVLTFVCRNPDFVQPGWTPLDVREQSTLGHPDNFDEFELPQTLEQTEFIVRFISQASRTGTYHNKPFQTEAQANQWITRNFNENTLVTCAPRIIPIPVRNRMTLDAFVQSVRDLEETI